MLPEVLATVGNKIDVRMDSGVRTGEDVLNAIALGSKGVMTSVHLLTLLVQKRKVRRKRSSPYNS
tara:strand:+ start:141 stop:335 length:195 start_codon:yes stop_codon:yes gene_type:complete